MTRFKTFLAAAVAVAGTSGIAMAQEAYDQGSVTLSPYYDGAAGAYAWSAPGLASNIGVGVEVGGGIGGFTDQAMRNVTSSVDGLWSVNVGLGTHVPIGLDLSYMGSAQRINALFGTAHGDLIGTTAEAKLRWNILPHEMVNPYIFGGVGWQHYDVTNTTFTLSDAGMNNFDNVAEFPMGAGIAFRADSGLTVDLKGVFRAVTDQNLVLKAPLTGLVGATSSSDYVPMHNWQASLAIGYEW